MAKNLDGNYLVVAVELMGEVSTKKYTFAYFGDSENIAPGKTVLVDTAYGFKVATVKDIYTKDDFFENFEEIKRYNPTLKCEVTREIVCEVDLTEFNKRAFMRAEKIALKKKMDKLLKESQELSLYQMVAETNPKMKEMLENYLANPY